MEIVRLPRIKGDYYVTTCCIYDCLATICNFYNEKIEWIFFDFLKVKYKKIPSIAIQLITAHNYTNETTLSNRKLEQ